MTENKLIWEKVKVEFVDIGEGINGMFNENDPNDKPLLRFYVSKFIDGEWQNVDSASYCTQVRNDTSKTKLIKLLDIIMNRVYDKVVDGDGIKKICEELSWMDGKKQAYNTAARPRHERCYQNF